MSRIFYLQLIIISSLFIVTQCVQLSPNFVIGNCSFEDKCSGSVNSSTIYYYSVEYAYIVDQTIRIETKMNYSIDQTDPILVVVRQVRGIVSWALPYEFPNGMLYTTVSRILCPENEDNSNFNHSSVIFIEVSTLNNQSIDYSIELQRVSNYVLKLDTNYTFNVSPSMPVYFKVFFPPNVNDSNVFVDAISGDTFCSIISVQSHTCPVYDVGEIGSGQGHYQTMSTRSSSNVYESEFKYSRQFLIVVLVKTTDTDCLDLKKPAGISPAGIIDVPRTKTISITVNSPPKVDFLIVTVITTALVFFLMYVIAFLIACKYPDIYDGMCREAIPLQDREKEREQELQERPRTRTESSTHTPDGEENIFGTRPEDFGRQVSTIEIIETSDRGFVPVTDLAVKDYNHLKQQFRIYPTTMVTIAIFYSLPVIQLVVQYQVNIDASGNEDICYFNFLCTRELFRLTAFNNIISNIGYTALGVLFFIIVYRRDAAYARFVERESDMAKTYGIPQHFGLFYAMAIGLMMEGVMSACYHVCPSRQNFQFDTSFMFIIGVLNLLKIYQTRHADINPNSAKTFSFLAIIIFITVIGVYFDKLWFWILYAILHVFICVIFTAKIYYMGRLKLTARFFIHLYRHLKYNGFFSRPRYVNRLVLLILGNMLNIAFALYGAIWQPESFPNHLLFVFLGNLALYLFYYFIMKAIHKERFTRFVKVSLFLSLLFWIPSLYFFYDEVKSYEVQPAISRTMNKPCMLLDTYDAHDIWHLLSSFALFFSFLSLLTIDDGVRLVQRTELAAF